MAERQRERLNLYLADLLKISSRVCDACKRESVIHPIIVRNYRLPHIDMRLCHCLSLRTHVLLQIEYQLQKGLAPVEERIMTLLSAAEEGLKTKNSDLVENVINKAKRLVSTSESAQEADALQVTSNKVTISRLRAQLKMKLGKNTEALRYLKQAMLLMGVTFPADITQNIYKKKKFDGVLGKEEVKCLGIGSFITMALGDYDFAYDLAKLQLKFLLKEGYTFDEIILTKTGVLTAVAKSKSVKSREVTTKKYSTEIQQQCFRRLTNYPVLDITEINVIAKAFITIIRISFERAELEAAEELGRKAYELMKIVRNQKALSRILCLMGFIYDYLQNSEKCVEMVNQLQDAVLQSDDASAQIYYYIVLAKTLTNKTESKISSDKIQMCNEYAKQCKAMPTHPKHTDRVFCLCAKMSTWCKNHKMKEAAAIWGDRAVKLQPHIQLNNYWSLAGYLWRVTEDITKIEEKCLIYTASEMMELKRYITQDLDKLNSAIKKFVPILEEDAKNVKNKFQTVIQKCRVLKT